MRMRKRKREKEIEKEAEREMRKWPETILESLFGQSFK